MNRSFLCSISLGAALVLASGEASAQPNPFDDYEAMKSGAPPKSAASSTEVRLPYQRKQWSVGLRTAFSYTGTNAGSIDGGPSESNTTFFYRVTPMVQYHVIDKLALGLSFGLLGKSVGREEGSGSRTETNWWPELTAHYVLPISSRFAFMPGVGIGPYFGGSSRELVIRGTGRTTTEETSTFGVAMSLYGHVGFQLSKHFQVRSGLGLFASVGNESISSKDASTTNTAANVTIPVELHFTF